MSSVTINEIDPGDTPTRLRIIWHDKITLNNRRLAQHWAANADENKTLRAWAATAAHRHPAIDPCTIEFLLIWPTGQLPDTDAAALAAKHVIDGLVDASVIADDTPKHVRAITFHAPQREAGPDGHDGHALICLVKPAAPHDDTTTNAAQPRTRRHGTKEAA